MSTDPIEVLREAIDKLTRAACYVPADQRMAYHEASAAAEQLLASLSAPKRHERPKGNSPIEELLAEYEADGCDHSDLHWVRAAARRYVETMEDSQIRCLLHVLSAHKSGSNMEAGASHVQGKPESAGAVDYTDIANRAQDATGRGIYPSTVKAVLNAAGFTAPPRPEASAPVGVEDECQLHREAHLRIDSILIGAGVFEVEHEGGTRETWENTIAAVQTLAQQPAAVSPGDIELAQGPDDIPRLLIAGREVAEFPAGSWPEVCEALDFGGYRNEQPAAVDEAMVERATTAFFTHPGRGVNGTDGAMRAALTAALSGQQGGE